MNIWGNSTKGGHSVCTSSIGLGTVLKEVAGGFV